MPKQASFDSEELLKILLEKKDTIIDAETKQIHKPSHICWIEISHEMKNSIKPKYVYTIVLQNRFGILSNLGLSLSQSSISTKHIHNESSKLAEPLDSDSETDEFDTLKFNITLSVEEWKRIYTPDKIYNRSDRINATRLNDVLTPNHHSDLIYSVLELLIHFLPHTSYAVTPLRPAQQIFHQGNIDVVR